MAAALRWRSLWKIALKRRAGRSNATWCRSSASRLPDGGRGRDRGGAHAGLDRRTNRLVARQLQRDPEVLDRDPERQQRALEARPRPRARLPQHPVRFQDVAGLDAGARGPGVLLADHDDELVAGDLDAGQRRLVDLALDKAELGEAVAHRARHLRRVADRHAHVDEGMGAAIIHEVARQPVAGDGLARLEAERAAPEAGELGQHELRRFRPGQHSLGLAQEQAPRPRSARCRDRPG